MKSNIKCVKIWDWILLIRICLVLVSVALLRLCEEQECCYTHTHYSQIHSYSEMCVFSPKDIGAIMPQKHTQRGWRKCWLLKKGLVSGLVQDLETVRRSVYHPQYTSQKCDKCDISENQLWHMTCQTIPGQTGSSLSRNVVLLCAERIWANDFQPSPIFCHGKL